MNAKEHNEAVHAQLEKVLPEKLGKTLPRKSDSFKDNVQKFIMSMYWSDEIQHIVNVQYGYGKPVEDTANTIINRLIDDIHLAAAES